MKLYKIYGLKGDARDAARIQIRKLFYEKIKDDISACIIKKLQNFDELLVTTINVLSGLKINKFSALSILYDDFYKFQGVKLDGEISLKIDTDACLTGLPKALNIIYNHITDDVYIQNRGTQFLLFFDERKHGESFEHKRNQAEKKIKSIFGNNTHFYRTREVEYTFTEEKGKKKNKEWSTCSYKALPIALSLEQKNTVHLLDSDEVELITQLKGYRANHNGLILDDDDKLNSLLSYQLKYNEYIRGILFKALEIIVGSEWNEHLDFKNQPDNYYEEEDYDVIGVRASYYFDEFGKIVEPVKHLA